MGIKRFIFNNIGLKLISLLLAIITWVYIVGELNKASTNERAALERLFPYRMTAKILPVELSLSGGLKEGYKILNDKIIIEPRTIMVIGPANLLDETSSVKTELIDVTGHTNSFSEDVSLLPLAKGLSIKEKFVSVTIPIQKIE